jgi:hypothetical protein
VNYTDILDALREFTTRERINMCGNEIHFRQLTGATQAFPEMNIILVKIRSGPASNVNSLSRRANLPPLLVGRHI